MNKFIVFSLFLSLSIKSICGVGSEKFSYAQEGELDSSKSFRRRGNYKEPVYAKVNKIPKPSPRKESKESDFEKLDPAPPIPLRRKNRDAEEIIYSDVKILPTPLRRKNRDAEESDYQDVKILPPIPLRRKNRDAEEIIYSDVKILPRTNRDSDASDYQDFDPRPYETSEN